MMASRKLNQKRGIRDFFLSLKLNCDNFVASYINFYQFYLILAAVPSVAWDFLHYKHTNLT
jgi:hypothetical protein